MSHGEPTVVESGLIRNDRDGPRLIGAMCASCGERSFPYANTCPWCGADDAREVALSPNGTLWGWTAVTAAPPGYEGPVPFGFGVVQLDDDRLRVVTRITEADPAALTFGLPMTLVYDPVEHDDQGRDVVTWAFAPSSG